MGKREAWFGIAFVVGSVGCSAMTEVGAVVFPHHEGLIFYLGLGAVIAAAVFIVALLVRPRLGLDSELGTNSDSQPKPEAPPAIKIGIAKGASFNKMRTHGEGSALEIERATDLDVDDWKHVQPRRDD